MRLYIGLIFTVILAVTVVFNLAGCEPDTASTPVPDTEEPGSDAVLYSFSLGDVEMPDIPAPISKIQWLNTDGVVFDTLGGQFTENVEYSADSILADLPLTVHVSDNAQAEYAASTISNERPEPAAFTATENNATLALDSYLYIRVTSENGRVVNYYRFALNGPPIPVTGIQLEKSLATLTVFSSEQLNWTFSPNNAKNRNIIWTSSDTGIVQVSPGGKITAVGFTSGGSNRFITGGTSAAPTTSPATGTAVVTATTADGGFTSSITVNTTMAAGENISTLPPLKDQFAKYFLMGNIFRGAADVSGTGADAIINNPQLTRHYNAITAENNMKPSYLVTGRNATTGAFTWSAANQKVADDFVDGANNSGMKVIGHTLLWHSQNPSWIWRDIASEGGSGTTAPGAAIAGKTQAIAIMKGYISEVVTRYAGKIYSWDVLNEGFPDSAGSAANWKDAMRKGASGEGADGNPWYIAIGSDFVYEGFLAARLADPKAILYYNDYNTDNPNRARLIRDMVQEVNAKYAAGTDKPSGEAAGRLLIEGIGMQEHHNNGITRDRIKATIDLFRSSLPGIQLSVSEMDILAYDSYNGLTTAGGQGAGFNNQAQSTNQQLLTQADLYGQFVGLYLENADIIKRVSLWGIQDNNSWRSRGLPLLFDQAGNAKPAYYKFVGALENYQ